MSDIEFIPNQINIENLSELTRLHTLLSEKRICELHEISVGAALLIKEMLNSGFGIYEALSLISQGFFEKLECELDNPQKEKLDMLASYVKAFSVYDKSSFSSLLLSKLSSLGVSVSEELFFDKEEREESIAFVKSMLASEAYDVFSADFNAPRLKYADDLKKAVSMVLSGDVGYAILPLEERGGARLSSITEILYKSELKINSVTPVFGALGNADMKYALVSPSISLPSCEEEDDRYLELRIPSYKDGSFSELISAAESLGIKVYRVNSLTFRQDGEDLPYFSLVLKKDSGDFTEMLVYLTLFVSDYSSVGIYKNLE